MDDTKNTNDEMLYSKKDFEELKAKLESEYLEKEKQIKLSAQQGAQKTNLSEMERVVQELEELKKKYQIKEDECIMAKEKEETLALLNEAELGATLLGVVYVPKNMQQTKLNIDTLRSYIEDMKKGMFQNCADTPLPQSSKQLSEDPFIIGFDTNEL